MSTKIIFDWDDTLMCTSVILKNVGYNFDEMDQLEQNIINVLLISITLGKVYIVTNAELSWVIYCVDNYFLKLKNLSILDFVTIISARDLYHIKYPDNPLIWKISTFDTVCRETTTNNVIAFGDAPNDRTAILSVVYNMNDCRIKSYKLCEFPDIKVMNNQLEFIIENLYNIVIINKNIDIELI
jgi:hypothetical protein